MTSAIEQICAMLDERGVKYDFTDRLREIPSYQSVTWLFNTADWATFREYHDGSTRLIVHSSKCGITPEEAIAATLGPGTCKARLYEPEYGSSDCTICECGEINDISANYCNRCGRQIEVVYE